jgi:hypothetical protein
MGKRATKLLCATSKSERPRNGSKPVRVETCNRLHAKRESRVRRMRPKVQSDDITNNPVEREAGMSRAVRFSQADLIRAMKAAEKAGYRVAGYEIKPDGAIRVEIGEEKVEDWRAGSPLYGKAA